MEGFRLSLFSAETAAVIGDAVEIHKGLPCIEQKFYFVQLNGFPNMGPCPAQSRPGSSDQSHVSFLYLMLIPGEKISRINDTLVKIKK